MKKNICVLMCTALFTKVLWSAPAEDLFRKADDLIQETLMAAIKKKDQDCVHKMLTLLDILKDIQVRVQAECVTDKVAADAQSQELSDDVSRIDSDSEASEEGVGRPHIPKLRLHMTDGEAMPAPRHHKEDASHKFLNAFSILLKSDGDTPLVREVKHLWAALTDTEKSEYIKQFKTTIEQHFDTDSMWPETSELSKGASFNYAGDGQDAVEFILFLRDMKQNLNTLKNSISKSAVDRRSRHNVQAHTLPTITEKLTNRFYAMTIEIYADTHKNPRNEKTRHVYTFTFTPQPGAMPIADLLKIVEAKEKK
ncbi:MAG: hypothetical protein Q8K36_01650 [Alphaproteobacteria bacterium]|nr:hypothetical protein [Alphaproteobacteria bacterium]